MSTPEPGTRDRSSLPVSQVSYERTKPEASPSVASSTPSRPAASFLLPVVLGLILMVPGALGVIVAAVDGHEIPIHAILELTLGLLLFVWSFVVYLQTRRRDSRMAQFIWQRGDGLAPLAESRGANATALFAIPFAIFLAVIVQVLVFDIPILIMIVVGSLLSILIVASLARSRVTVQSDSVLLGIPSGPMMGRLPLDKMLSIRLRGRFLRVVLKEKANPLSSRTQRIVILGDPTPIATVIQAIGVSRGYDFSIEDIEVDTELLKSTMEAMQEKEEGPRKTIDGEYIEHTSYPEVISILLVIAGASAFLSTMVLLAIDRAIADDIGRHIAEIGCCYILEALLGVLVLSGAVMARKRRKYRLVVTSAVLATINILGIISIIVGIVSLVLLRKCADEFKD